ncbi:MAG: sulfatase-like hydrolase/transferase [Planctomycetota bacterium]
MQLQSLTSAAVLAMSGLVMAQPIASWDMRSVQDVAEAGVGFPRGNPVVADRAPGGIFGGLLEDNPVFAALRGGAPLGVGDDLLWYFNPLTGHEYPTAAVGAPAEFYNPTSLFSTGDGVSYDVTATLDPNLDPGVSGRVEGAFYPIGQYGNEFELLGTHTHEFMFRSNGDTTDLNGDGLWTGNFAPSGGPSTNGFFVPAKDNQVIWWHDGPARLLVNASEGAPGGLRMSIAGLDGLGNNLFATFDANARNYLNGEWVYVKLTYDASAPTLSGAQYRVEITTDTDPGAGVSLVTDRVVGNFDPSWAGLRPGPGANPLIGLRSFGDNFNGRQFDGFIDAIQISDGEVSATDMMGVTVPPPSASYGPIAHWGMAPAFDTVTDPRNPGFVLNPGEDGVQPATLDSRTSAGEGDVLGGASYTPTFPYGSREAVAQTGPADDHLWCFTSENYDTDGRIGDFPRVAFGAPAWLFAPGKAPVIPSSFDSSAFDAPASGSLVYPSDRYGDEMAFQGSFTLEAVYNTASSATQTLIFQGEARERYSLRVSASGAVFTLVDANGTADLAVLGNEVVSHVGGAWIYTRAIYDENAGTLTIASRDEFGNEDAVSVSSVPGFGPLPTGSDGNMFIGRDVFDPALGPTNFSGLIDEIQITRGVVASADAMVLLSTDPMPACSPADIDRDGLVTPFDLIALLNISESAPNCPADAACAIADLDRNNTVDVFDLIALLRIYDPNDPNCQGPARRPNVILIKVDDQGYGDLSVHGNPVLSTPNLDRLHAESVRLTDFHVAPMCSPSRGQLITGRDAMRNGSTFVAQGRSMVRAEIPTIAEFFAEAGYATSHVAKWHLGDSYPHRPQDRGFQDTFHHRAWGITSLADYWGNDYFDPILNLNGIDVPTTGYCTDTFFDYAMDWITQHESAGDDPFFMYLATNTPHGPDLVPNAYSDPYIGTYNGITVPHKFYGMIANLDENLGRLEAFLSNNNLRDDTIIIYMSDNGTQSRAARDIHNAGMRGFKQSVYDGGHRVPFFVRWPNGPLAHGRDVDELTQVQDVLPTLIELCGLNAPRIDPNNPTRATLPSLVTDFDGDSIVRLLDGSSDELHDRMLVIQYRVSGEKWDPAVVLWDKWRLVNPGELYNIETDPSQMTNVAAQFPLVAQAMEDHYDDWYDEVKPQFDIERWIRVDTDRQGSMKLYSQDWVGDFCDNRGGLSNATAVGYWNIEVATSGVYDIELRRWPEESGLPFPAGFNPADFTAGTRGARPITAANLQVAGGNYTLDTWPEATSAVFRVYLDEGRHRLQTHLLDGQDRIICSAMYTQMTRVDHAPPNTLTSLSSRLPNPQIQPGPVIVAQPVTLAPDDVLMADFEGADFGDWVLTGTAFASGPVAAGNRIVGFEGLRVLDTFIGNGNSDGPTGTLTSPVFMIDRDRINFRIGGGSRPYLTQVDLVINGQMVRSAIGNQSRDDSGRKIMQWVSWDVSEFAGSQATIRITDASSDGWGHIVVDQIYRSNRAPGQ